MTFKDYLEAQRIEKEAKDRIDEGVKKMVNTTLAYVNTHPEQYNHMKPKTKAAFLGNLISLEAIMQQPNNN